MIEWLGSLRSRSATAEWESWAPADLFPAEIAALVSTVSSTGDAVATVLDVAATIIDLVATFISGFSDPQAALIQALIDAINSAIQALTQTGVFMLAHYPASATAALTPANWLADAAASLDDLFDKERPILTDPSAFVGAVTLMAVAPDFRVLYNTFREFFDLFKASIPSLAQMLSLKLPGEVANPAVFGVGRKPDWRSLTIVDLIPPIGLVVQELRDLIKLLTPALSGGDIYSLYAQLLRDKATLLRAFSTTIQDQLDLLTTALQISGVYLLPTFIQGDAAAVKNQLLNSTGGPLDLQGTQVAAGFVFLTTGGTTAPRDILFDLFGVDKATTA